MSKLLTVFIIMMSINLVLWITQLSMGYINPVGSPQFFNVSDSPASHYMSNGELINTSSSDVLPLEVKGSESGGVGETVQGLFTDPVSTMKNFFINTLGLGQVASMLKAPYDFIKAVGVPQEIALMFAVLWYGFTLLLLALVVIGRE